MRESRFSFQNKDSLDPRAKPKDDKKIFYNPKNNMVSIISSILHVLPQESNIYVNLWTPHISSLVESVVICSPLFISITATSHLFLRSGKVFGLDE